MTTSATKTALVVVLALAAYAVLASQIFVGGVEISSRTIVFPNGMTLAGGTLNGTNGLAVTQPGDASTYWILIPPAE